MNLPYRCVITFFQSYPYLSVLQLRKVSGIHPAQNIKPCCRPVSMQDGRDRAGFCGFCFKRFIRPIIACQINDLAILVRIVTVSLFKGELVPDPD